MKIKKRDGTLQQLSFNKIIYRLKKLCNDKSLGKLHKIDPDIIAQKVVSSLYPEITSTEIDEEAARIAISITENRDFAKLASRIIISNLHKNTIECFSEVMELLNEKHEIIKPEILQIIKENRDTIDLEIDYQRDYIFDYFGYKTLEKSYLMRTYNENDGKMVLVERPQHLYMRVALAIHLDDIPNVLKTYNLISQHMFTFASPTMFNAATKAGNLSSCFLQNIERDSLEGIFKAYTDSAKISKIGGGIGVSVSDIRAKGSLIRGTNGISDGLVPLLKVYNEVACYINQCFTPDTWVYSDSGPKEMKDITTNDSLITIDGSFKKVNEIIINTVDKEILQIQTSHSLFPVKVTKEHELYLLKSKSHIFSEIKQQLKMGEIKPDFYSAINLSGSDLVCFPIPTYELDNDNHDLNYYYNHGKHIDTLFNNEFLHLPKDKINELLKGLCDNTNKKTEALNMQVRYLQLRLGMLNDDYFEFNDMLFTRIRSIKKINYSGKVYDFNMIDNHNYLTDMGLVHNSGRRKGSFAMYLEPWHADIMEFIDLRKNQGSENMRARDLFYALWICDDFMKAVKDDAMWYLMCPDQCANLTTTYGDEFSELYWGYVEKKMYRKEIKAHKIWTKILESQIETGMPYILYKDSINKKSNQKNIGVIKGSNLCVAPETMILTSTGYYPIVDLVNKKINIWNGQEFTETTVCQTGKDVELLKVILDNGSEIECTEYHKFYTHDMKKIDAKDLQIGMTLIKSDFPVIKTGLTNFNHENSLIVPINYSLDIKMKWLQKLCNHCSTVINNELHITIIDTSLLNKIKYMLNTLGCDPKIVKNALIVSNNDAINLQKLGLNVLNMSISNKENYNYIGTSIKEIVKTNRISDTYCFKEEKRGMGVFNGVLTGQCAEITLVANDKETAVCNLASIPLPKYVEYNKGKPFFNFEKLHEMASYVVHGLTNVIKNNVYPISEAKHSNMANMPVGLGIQGQNDAYIKMRIPFDSPEARQLNKEIFETIYHGAITGSMELAKKHGHYKTFKDSPFSQGKFQFDLAKEFDNIDLNNYLSDRYDWDILRKDVVKYGTANSMLTALMPTASSSQIMHNCESFDPINSNIYKRRVQAGEYIIVNKYLVDDLTELKLWNKEMKDLIIEHDGSIQNIDSIPDDIKLLYKTCWELSMKNVIDQASDRQVFIDQTQSMNLFVKDPTFSKLTSMHFYGHSKNLKTGMYYLRSTAKSGNMKVIDKSIVTVKEEPQEEDCINCSS
jgi:ribonucleotide reductase alpha subunit